MSIKPVAMRARLDGEVAILPNGHRVPAIGYGDQSSPWGVTLFDHATGEPKAWSRCASKEAARQAAKAMARALMPQGGTAEA